MRLPAVLAVTLIVLMITGCRTPDPVVTPAPESTSTPLFASEEEALAAAEEAYAAYLAVSDQIQTEGGVGSERIYSLVAEGLREGLSSDFAVYRDSGWTAIGATTFDSVQLQQLVQEGTTASATTYLCLDVSNVQLIDSTGQDITPPARQNRVPLEIAFVAEASSTFVIERSEVWSGDDFCN